MDIYLDRRAVKQIKLSAEEAIEEGDTDTLREDIMEAFSDEQIEEIERRIDSGDFYDFLTEMLDEWSGDDSEELFELLESQLGDAGVDLKLSRDAVMDEEEEEEPEEEELEAEAEEVEDIDEEEIGPPPMDEELL